MIPADWMPHRRADGEVVGYLHEEGDAFQARDLFGRPLGDPVDWLAAEEALEAHGLAWLMEPFLLEVDGAPVQVRVVEVTPRRVRVTRDDFGDLRAQQEAWEVPVPVEGRLRPAPPRTEWPGFPG